MLNAIRKIDKSMATSIALHAGVIVWSIVSFSTRALDAVPLGVNADVITSAQFDQMTKGVKTAALETNKPLVDKLGESKPAENVVGKIDEKKDIQTSTETPPEPPVPKPVEKKPEPPKPPEPKQVEKKPEPKPEPKVDPIAEALKKEQAKKPPEKKPEPKPEPPKQQAKQEPPKPKQPPKDRVFDPSAMEKLLVDKRAPTRQAALGETLNHTTSVGSANSPDGRGASRGAAHGFKWVGALEARIKECWNLPPGIRDASDMKIVFAFELRRDGSVIGMPRLVQADDRGMGGKAVVESGIRAIQQCQPYSFLPQAEYIDGWDRLELTMSARDLFR